MSNYNVKVFNTKQKKLKPIEVHYILDSFGKVSSIIDGPTSDGSGIFLKNVVLISKNYGDICIDGKLKVFDVIMTYDNSPHTGTVDSTFTQTYSNCFIYLGFWNDGFVAH